MHSKTKTNTELPQTMGSTLNNLSTRKYPCLRMDSSLSHRGGGGGGGLNAFNWCHILALDSVVVKIQNCLACMEAS